VPIRTKLNQDLRPDYGFNGSTLEDIDQALYGFLDNELNIFCDTNSGAKKVPVIFSSPERAYSIKNDPTLRNNTKTLEYPLISVARMSIDKNPANKGRYGVYIPPYFDFYHRGGSIPIARRVVQGKTRERANATAINRFGNKTDKTYQTFPFDNKKVVYETLYVPNPTFVEVTYEVVLISDYQQQMNQMMTPFLTKFSTPAVFNIKYEGNSYETFIEQSFANQSNNTGLETEERIFQTTVTFKVLGYLIGDGTNQETPVITVRESAAEVTIQRERAVVGDKPEYDADRRDRYRS